MYANANIYLTEFKYREALDELFLLYDFCIDHELIQIGFMRDVSHKTVLLANNWSEAITIISEMDRMKDFEDMKIIVDKSKERTEIKYMLELVSKAQKRD